MKKYFLKDQSLDNVDDDQFRYQDFANNLRKIIECNDAPFNIAIIGKWGLGKSSLINMALAPLRKNKKEFLICDINAWKYEKDEIGKAFLKELWEGISEKNVLSFYFFHKEYSNIIEGMFKNSPDNPKKNKGISNFCKYVAGTFLGSIILFIVYCVISNNFYGVNFNYSLFAASTFIRYCKNIGSILIVPIVVWLGKLFMDKLNEPALKKYEISFPLVTQSDYEIYLKNLLKEYYENNPNKKIVVVIDDLDRLSANKIVEALDALKLFMEYDRFIFIVPFDDEILKNALKLKKIDEISVIGNEYDGEMVLDKLFQYKMYLPQLIKYDMRNYAFKICKKDCVDFIREYCNDDYKLFEEIVGKLLIHSGVSTPRQVKKIVNAFVENVMIASDRAQAGKVGEKFVTEKKGLQTIAKISVLQSDYNEFYDLLFKDANAINEILDVHRSNGETTPSELLRSYFDDKHILRIYEPLVNYLIFTENLGYKNITPYLYMAQTKEGVLVGDQKQQDFISAIESCNFVTVKQLINETPILTSLLMEQLKYDESPLMGNIVLSAIDCYDTVLETNKEELAISITERIPELSNSYSDFRYDLINAENLIEVCRRANSNEHNNLIECAIKRNQEDKDYKNEVILINKLSQIKHELLDITLGKFESYVKNWITSDESGIQDIIDYVATEQQEYIANAYGKEYVQKVAKHITDNDDFDEILIKQFGNIVSVFLNSNSLIEIIDAIKPCYDYPILYKMLDESIDKIKYKDLQNPKDIAEKIVSIGVNKLKGVYGYNILSKLSYRIEHENAELFDGFFMDTIGETEFADMIEAFSVHNTIDMLQKTIDRLNTYAFEEKGYAPDIRRLLKLCVDEQQNEFWEKLGDYCEYSDREYEITMDLIVEISKDVQYDKDMVSVIENKIISEGGKYYNRNEYLSFAIQTVSMYKDKISQNILDEYSTALMKVISTDTNNILNAYRVVNKLNGEEFWCKHIEVILQYVSKGTYTIIYDIITSRINLFNKENNNLTILVEFLVDYINLSDNPDDVINLLSTFFSRISNIDKLVHMLKDIEYDEDNASTKLARLFDASDLGVIVKIITDECTADDVYKDKIKKLLSNSANYSSYELLHRINKNKENINKNEILTILDFCEGSITENNIESFVDIVAYLLTNYLEKDICSQILLRISNLPDKVLAKQRESICNILVEIFRKSSSDENRRKSSILIKDKGFGRKMRGILDEDELKDYKSYL